LVARPDAREQRRLKFSSVIKYISITVPIGVRVFCRQENERQR
jgi:hypothetical protein